MTRTAHSRALGALTGLALGDALGMPTQSMSRNQITAAYGGPVTGLVDSSPTQPIAPGMAAGTITDDTEQAILVAELLIAGAGTISAADFAAALTDWERTMAAKGSLDLLGPSTKAAIDAVHRGVAPTEAGKRGTTNGSAMRITPVGIAFPPDPKVLLPAVLEASQVTHNTGLGLAGAAAVATAVSTSITGTTLDQAVAEAIEMSAAAQTRGAWVAGASIPARIGWAIRAISGMSTDGAVEFIAEVIGTSVASQESVVAAFALVTRFRDDPWAALVQAANIGGDTDTIAAMAGAILGAHHGVDCWPEDAVDMVTTVNHLDLAQIATRLLQLRETGTAAANPCD